MASLWKLLTQPSVAVKETDPPNGNARAAAAKARNHLETTLDELDALLRKKNRDAPVVDR